MFEVQRRGLLISVHIADLHFAAFNPRDQFSILEAQFLQVIDKLPRIDVISIDGDIFDHKLMGNSDGIYYASVFIDRLIWTAKKYQATVLIIHGTFSHDADQLKLFYHYMNDPSVDVRIINTIKFEVVKNNARILCIPELYGVDESVYQNALHYSGYYDEAFIHGTFQGAVYGDNVGNGRLFTPADFNMCRGLVVGGHVHKPGCHKGFFYYAGCPYRWKFGEEEAKGFLITSHDLDTNMHYVHFQEIKSSTYTTLQLDDITQSNPKDMIDYINKLKKDRDIDYLKVRIGKPLSGADKVILSNYYRNSPYTFIEFIDNEKQRLIEQGKTEELAENLRFILDDKLSEMEKFVRYVNFNEGYEFITLDRLTEILEEDI